MVFFIPCVVKADNLTQEEDKTKKKKPKNKTTPIY